jgi:hypothetical protein
MEHKEPPTTRQSVLEAQRRRYEKVKNNEDYKEYHEKKTIDFIKKKYHTDLLYREKMIERNKAYYHHKKQLASKQNILAS